ncbi:putative toxin-antitoxin system toxin component, PIN family [Rhodopila globiformis]|uniref:Putative toxin-antitoxin system toxin component, PIN family n=1 Tax=Rhodopila globiformis TaxID=1071 RepID=A0A2S6NNU5_RHOGL|nr:putative toxin-antitoxin system toxin component, PIN family [Rhodopila globiformis]PPQ39515.1 putative toxin-antitoxin system toxin component, PIN family [Rhodopila globiformis]
MVAPIAVPAVVAADPDDDHVIAAAVAAEADLIVTGDSDLLVLGHHGDIRIVTPAEAIARIGVS